jgi:hypothetical protein
MWNYFSNTGCCNELTETLTIKDVNRDAIEQSYKHTN